VYCPKCRSKFREGFVECSDCHVPLKSGPLPDPPPPDPVRQRPSPTPQDLELVAILECENSVKLALAEGILDDAGIPYFVNSRWWGPVSKHRANYVKALGGEFPLRIQVASDRAAEARALLAHLSES
jgi:Putative prokaryotic signal transducing protein